MAIEKHPVLADIGGAEAAAAFRQYPHKNLTPQKLAGIFEEADAGGISRQAELFSGMEETDAHLGAVLQTRKAAVAGLEWELSPASGNARDAEAAEFARRALMGMDNFQDSLFDMMDAIGKGFSVCEIMWQIDKGRVRARELRRIDQARFTFMMQGGGLSDIPKLVTKDAPAYGIELIPNKFIVHKYGPRSGHPSQSGLLRPCAWMYLFKNYALKDWAVFNERFAMPMRLGKFSAGASEAERRVLKNAVFNLGSDAAAVISDNTVIELLEQSGKAASAELFERMADYCDRAVSKAVLGQTLTTEQSNGTYATARIHQTVRRDLIEADSTALALAVTNQLIRPMTAYNFGPDARAPRFRFMLKDDVDMKALAETYKTLKEIGLNPTERHLAERFGIPLSDIEGAE